jgi:hypothetical protein
MDILLPGDISDRYDFFHDKGTFDAMMLNPSVSDKYSGIINPFKKFIKSHSNMSSHLIITSCNFTESELLSYFSDWTAKAVIKHPSFSFGGSVGQTVSTVVFSL